MFRVETVVILLEVGAAIDIPSLNRAHTPTDRVGVVGSLDAGAHARVGVTLRVTSIATQFVRGVAIALGVARAESAAGLSPRQIAKLSRARPLSITSVHPDKSGRAADPTSFVGVILIFIMPSQYLGWILVGAMEEKSNRIVKVLLSTVRPIQVVTGKVLGIDLVAFALAGIILA